MAVISVLGDCALVALGGGLGALTRFGVEQLPFLEHDKYYFTVAINITGCLVIGFLWALFQHLGLSRWVYLLALTGFLGGYTTYSSFTLDAMQLIHNGRIGEMLFYVAVTVFGGLGACAVGLFGTEKLLKMI